MNIKESVDREPTDIEGLSKDIELLTANVMSLASVVESMNDVLMVVMHNLKKTGLEIPEWKTVKEAEVEVLEEYSKCVSLMHDVKEAQKKEAKDGQRKAD